MKSKMKTTFALIAVALMVMVAVVPMVGILTDNSSAEVHTVPAVDYNNGIGLDVSVNDAAGQKVVNGTIVQVAYGSYKWTELTVDGVASFTFVEASISKLTINVLDIEGAVDPNYAAVTMSDLVADHNYTATLTAGKIRQYASFLFENGTDIDELLEDGASISANYEVYDSAEATKYVISGKVVFEWHTILGLTAYFEYPLQDYEGDMIYVTIKDFKSGDIKLTFAAKAEISIDDDAEFRANETLVTINPAATVISVATVDSLTAYYTSEQKEKSIKFSKISDEMLYIENASIPALYYADLTPAGDNDITYKIQVKAGGTTSDLAEIAINQGEGTYTPAGAIIGMIVLGTSFQSGTLSFDIRDPNDETKKTSIKDVKVDEYGIFFKFIKITEGYTEITNIKFSSGGVTFDATTEDPYDDEGDELVDMAITGTGYALVAGTLKLADNIPVDGKKINYSSGVKVFGSTVTDEDGAFSFYAEEGKNVTLSVDGAAISGDVNIIPGQGSGALALIMGVQTVSVKLQDALGDELENMEYGATLFYDADRLEPVMAGDDPVVLVWNEDDEVYEADIRADLVATKLYVQPFADDYMFDAGLYAKDKVFKANEATYGFGFFTADGDLIALGADNVKAYYASVYKNSVGVFVYDYDIETPINVEYVLGVFALDLDKTIANRSSKDVGVTPINVVIIVPQAGAATMGIFDELYIYTADSEGMMEITSAVDSLNGTLTKIDGVTPIVGIKVVVGTAKDAPDAVTTYTKAGGAFSVTYPTKITNAVKAFFTNTEGYQFAKAGYPVVVDDEKVTEFTPDAEPYKLSVVDSDGEKYTPVANDLTFKYDGGAATAFTNGSYSWEAGKTIVVTSAATLRTFEPYTLTEKDVSTGKVTIPTEQFTCVVMVVDGSGAGINGKQVTTYAEFGGVTYGAIPAGVPAVAAGNTATIDGVDGLKEIVLTDLSNKVLADAEVTGYAVKIAGITGPSKDKYIDIEDELTVVASTTATIEYKIVDAVGSKLSTGAIAPAANTVHVYKEDGTEYVPGDLAITTSKVTFTGDVTEGYTLTIPDIMNAAAIADATFVYSFEEKLAPVLGKLYANEEWIYGNVLDGAGNTIGVAGATTVKATYIDGTDSITFTYAAEADGKYVKLLVDVDAVATYSVVNSGLDAVYKFKASTTPYIVSPQMPVEFSAVTANGYEVPADFENIKAFDMNGSYIGKMIGDNFIVDPSEVVYYTADVDDDLLGLTYSGVSLDGVFIADESLLTGSVPKSNAEQTVIVNLMKDGAVVDFDEALIVGSIYYAYLDISGEEFTAGVAYDSIVADYYENDILVSSTEISATGPTPIIVIPAPEPEMMGSDMILEHYSATVVGSLIVLAADQSFDVVVGTTQVEGKQLVDRYTFAGWYVNGEKVSASANYSVLASGKTAVYADYSVQTIEVVAPQPEPTPTPEPTPVDNSIDPTVLVIGICAVIVALIAVAYAVIASRPKEKKE